MQKAVATVRRRRRGRSTLGVLTAVGAVGIVAVGGIALGGLSLGPHGASTPQVAVALQSTTTSPASSPTPAPPSAGPAGSSSSHTSLTSAFGNDYSDLPNAWGDLKLTASSDSAKGLPVGYEAAISLRLLGPEDTIERLCQALNEKGASSSGCTKQSVGGTTLYRSVTEGANLKIGTFRTLRFLYQRPDHTVQYAELTIWNTAHATSAAERANGSAWIDAQSNKIQSAAIAPLTAPVHS